MLSLSEMDSALRFIPPAITKLRLCTCERTVLPKSDDTMKYNITVTIGNNKIVIALK